jgi:hypothetical protein
MPPLASVCSLFLAVATGLVLNLSSTADLDQCPLAMKVYMVSSIVFGYLFPFMFGMLLLKPNLKETGVLVTLSLFLLYYILLFMFNVVGTASIAASDSTFSCLIAGVCVCVCL